MNSIWFRLKKCWFTKVLRQQWRYISLPKINKTFEKFNVGDFVSVQPMKVPCGSVFFIDIMDENNPKIGQIFTLKEKNPDPKHQDCPPLCCCVRGPSWHKIWTHAGWVFEEIDEKAYKEAVEKYHGPYMEREKARHEKLVTENEMNQARLVKKE